MSITEKTVDIQVENLSLENKFIKPSEDVWNFRDILLSYNLDPTKVKVGLKRVEAGFWNTKKGIYGHCGCTGNPEYKSLVQKTDENNVFIEMIFTLDSDIDSSLSKLDWSITKGGRGNFIKPYRFQDLSPFVGVPVEHYVLLRENDWSDHWINLLKKSYDKGGLDEDCFEYHETITPEQEKRLLCRKIITKKVPRSNGRYLYSINLLSIDIEKNLGALKEALILLSDLMSPEESLSVV